MIPLTFMMIGMLVTGFLLVIVAIFVQVSGNEKVDDVPLTVLIEEKIKGQEEAIGEFILNKAEDEKQPAADPTANSAVSVDQSNSAITDVDSMINSMNTSIAVEEIISAPQSNKIDINTATVDQLQQLKGIGPSKAAAIIADREQKGKFKNIADIKRVKGIGEKLYSGIEESIEAER